MAFAADNTRRPGEEHIPRYTPGFIVLRILQLIVGLVVLGLSAYSVAVIPFSGNCLTLFTALVTTIVTIWIVSAHGCAKRLYNYWAVLTFDIFLFLFWLVSFILLGLQAVWILAASSSHYHSDSYDSILGDYYGYGSYGLSDSAAVFGAVIASAAGLGALNCLFFFISMVIHSIVVHRHRRSGLHSKPVARGYTQPYQTGVPQYYAVAQGQNAFVQQPMAYNPNMPYAAPKQQYPVAYPPQGYVPSHAASP